MKAKLLITLLVFTMSAGVKLKAQTIQPVKRLEIEAKVGATFPVDKFVGSKKLGPQFGLEGRWNFDKPFDVGLEVYMGSAIRDYEGHTLSNRIFSFLSVYGDYNFNRGSKVAPFVGVGIGDVKCDVIQGSEGREGMSLMVVPRVGVELWNHLRLTADLRLARKGYNTVGISIGYTFGGGRK